ncbi:MAG: phosphatase PAP2 family protein [Anaerolineae bacterium]
MMMETPTPDSTPADPIQPAGLLSMYLLVGIAILLIGSWAFYSIAEDVMEQDAIVQIDQSIADFVHASVTPSTAQFMLILTMAGNELVVVVSLVLALALVLRRRWRDLLLLGLAVGGAEVIVPLIKLVVSRQRPVFSDPIQVINNFSFPSGHSFLSVVFYGLIAYLLLRVTNSILARAAIMLAALAIILMVGFTRIYLGVHFMSDVLGGYLGGLAWLALTITGVELLMRWQARRRAWRLRMETNQPRSV